MSTFIALLVFFSLCADGFNLRRQFKLHESSVHSFPPLSDCKECYQKKITKINLLSATPMEKQKDVAEAHEGLVNLKGDSETLSKEEEADNLVRKGKTNLENSDLKEENFERYSKFLSFFGYPDLHRTCSGFSRYYLHPGVIFTVCAQDSRDFLWFVLDENPRLARQN